MASYCFACAHLCRGRQVALRHIQTLSNRQHQAPALRADATPVDLRRKAIPNATVCFTRQEIKALMGGPEHGRRL